MSVRSIGSLLVVSALLGAAGCDGGPPGLPPASGGPSVEASATPAVEGDDLAVKIIKPPPDYLSIDEVFDAVPPAGADATVLAQVIEKIRQETLILGRVKGGIAVKCAGGRVALSAGAKTRCTATYARVTIPWIVTIDAGVAPTDRLVRYRVTLEGKSVLRAKAVYGAFWDLYMVVREKVNPDGIDPRLSCDAIPDAQLADLGRTGHRCQYLEDFVGTQRWVRYDVLLDGSGAVTFDQP
ncbi:hypothetical protein ACTMTJ_44735 [Phytohabitans sp. LJ34]|uniref:hypothetical protein n=1 Tax=Phytohabitans sp. LJ34 TaxID=3452217 RepID=UPI003F8C8D3B